MSTSLLWVVKPQRSSCPGIFPSAPLLPWPGPLPSLHPLTTGQVLSSAPFKSDQSCWIKAFTFNISVCDTQLHLNAGHVVKNELWIRYLMNTMVLPKILIARKVTIWWPLTYLSPCKLKPQPINTDARVCVSSALWSSVRDFLFREMKTSHLNCVTHREPKLCTHPGPWLRKAWEDPALGLEVFLEGCELCV